MAEVDIGSETYDSYISVEDADVYLAADVSRAPVWSALSEDDKGRGLVTATRLLQRQTWVAGAPPLTDDPVAPPVPEATALLAVDILNKPALGDGSGTGSNVKAVGAGPARVEFFMPTKGQALPSAAFDLLRGLLGPAGGSDSPALDGTAYGSHDCQRSRFDPTDYTLVNGPLDERLY